MTRNTSRYEEDNRPAHAHGALHSRLPPSSATRSPYGVELPLQPLVPIVFPCIRTASRPPSRTLGAPTTTVAAPPTPTPRHDHTPTTATCRPCRLLRRSGGPRWCTRWSGGRSATAGCRRRCGPARPHHCLKVPTGDVHGVEQRLPIDAARGHVIPTTSSAEAAHGRPVGATRRGRRPKQGCPRDRAGRRRRHRVRSSGRWRRPRGHHRNTRGPASAVGRGRWLPFPSASACAAQARRRHRRDLDGRPQVPSPSGRHRAGTWA